MFKAMFCSSTAAFATFACFNFAAPTEARIISTALAMNGVARQAHVHQGGGSTSGPARRGGSAFARWRSPLAGW